MSIHEFYAAFAAADDRLFSALRQLAALDDLKSLMSSGGDKETGPGEWGMWTESAATTLQPA